MGINWTETVRFLRWIDTTSHNYIWQTFDDSPEKRPTLACAILAEPMDTRIEALHTCGAAVCVQVNGGAKRGAAHITGIRAVWLDMDGAPLKPVIEAVRAGRLAKPGMVIESSPGRYHVYWRAMCAVSQFGYIQAALARMFDGDPSVINPDRVMRVPGTLNRKHHGEAFEVRLTHYVANAPLLDIDALLSTGPTFDASVNESFMAAAAAPVIEALPSGDRTQQLISLAGRIVLKFPDIGPDQVMVLLKRVAASRLPDGDTPKTEASWANEILPGVRRFCERRDTERAAVDKAKADEVARLSISLGSPMVTPYAQMLDVSPLRVSDFMNRFVYVSVERLVYDITKSPKAPPWTLDAFKIWACVHRDGDAKIMNLWLNDAKYRRTVHSTTYVPYRYTHNEDVMKVNRIVNDPVTGELAYNTYAPPTLRPADVIDIEKLRPFVEHVDGVFLDPADREVFYDWAAYTIQRPQVRVPWAPLVISTSEGVGKGLIGQTMQRLVGISNYKVIMQEQLESLSGFNEFLSGSTLVVIEEVAIRRRKDLKNKLNAMITEPLLEVNTKFGAKRMEQIYCNFMLFSNHPDCIPLTDTDRRFWVTINDSLPRSNTYFAGYAEWLRGDGPAHAFRWLLDRDISRFEVSRPPMTAAKQRLIMSGMDDVELTVMDAVKHKLAPFNADLVMLPDAVDYVSRELVMVADQRLRNRVRDAVQSMGALVGRFRPEKHASNRVNCYCVRNRAKWLAQSTSELQAEIMRMRAERTRLELVR